MTVANIETIGSSEYLLALALPKKNQRVESDVSEPYNSYGSFFS